MNEVNLIAPGESAASLIEERGWTQGKWGIHGEGPLCMHGALRLCAPEDGDAYLIEEVYNRRGFGTGWNDESGRGKSEVLSVLRTAAGITDGELADTFGPQWREIVALARRAAALTKNECHALRQPGGAWMSAAWNAGCEAACCSAGLQAWGSAMRVTGYAAMYAAGALSIRHLIGGKGFARAHYDTLTGPWRITIGPVHPDDDAIG